MYLAGCRLHIQTVTFLSVLTLKQYANAYFFFIITTNRRYHQRLCLEAWHINSAHAPLNRDDGGLLPDAYLHLVRKKGS